MKIMALCTVDKEKLKKQKNLSAEANHENVIPEEFSQLRRAGIVFDNCVEVDTAKVDDEYQAYVWSIEQKGTFLGGEDCGLKDFAEPDLLKR